MGKGDREIERDTSPMISNIVIVSSMLYRVIQFKLIGLSRSTLPIILHLMCNPVITNCKSYARSLNARGSALFSISAVKGRRGQLIRFMHQQYLHMKKQEC